MCWLPDPFVWTTDFLSLNISFSAGVGKFSDADFGSRDVHLPLQPPLASILTNRDEKFFVHEQSNHSEETKPSSV